MIKEINRRGLLAAGAALFGISRASGARAQEEPEVAGEQVTPGDSSEGQARLPEQASLRAVLQARGLEKVNNPEQVAITSKGGEISAFKTAGTDERIEIERPLDVKSLADAKNPDRDNIGLGWVPTFEGMVWNGIQFEPLAGVKLNLEVGAPMVFFKIGKERVGDDLALYVSPSDYNDSIDVYKQATPEEQEFVNKGLATNIGERMALDGENNTALNRIPEAFALGHGSPDLPAAFQIKV